jgi:hypothetical protein
MTEGHSQGHAPRSCLIGMHLARQLGLPPGDAGDLFYALLLKDACCSPTWSMHSRATAPIAPRSRQSR